ncbi:MAG: excinuclease ABC subunit UvrC [Gammaproteobacteria bacterium]|nr:excinuclease ABC subunit UvrC [Gammaproteobacteria bacterium]
MRDIPSFLAHLTHHPGVYQMLDATGKVIYVGKARDLKKRLSSYFSSSAKDIKTTALLKHLDDITITVTRDENEALLLECNLIKQHRPHYNVLFRDDKSYPYIWLTQSTFPRITLYRGNKKQSGQFFGPYSDTLAVRETITLIEKLFKIRNCTDSFFAARKRPCIQYDIQRCTAPCTKYVTPEEYAKQVHHAVLFLQGKDQQVIQELTEQMETFSTKRNFEKAADMRDLISRLREMQAVQTIHAKRGDVDVLGMTISAGVACIQLLMIRHGRMTGSRAFFPVLPANVSREEILSSFIEQYYFDRRQTMKDIPREIILDADLPEHDWLQTALSEKTQRKVILTTHVRGERHQWLKMAEANARQAVSTRLLDRATTQTRYDALMQLFEFDSPNESIECVDISHTMGEATVGSCVVFGPEGPRKSDYRRFNITEITPGDDTAAITQVLQRRYPKLQKQQHLPRILFIDGGVPQLNAAKKVLKNLQIEGVLLIGIAKGRTRKPGFETLHFVNQPALHLPHDSLALHFIQQIRDEAHRFAITGHRMRRDKKRVTSSLESIPGIGAKRRRDILRYFGGIQAVNRASLEEIAKVPGISLSLAQKIFDTLHRSME